MQRRHRDQKDIPVEPVARQDRVWWLREHPAWNVSGVFGHPWNRFEDCVRISFAYVDPGTHRIESDEARNTHFEVWLEAGPMHDQAADTERDPETFPAPEDGWDGAPDRWVHGHDPDLDCGADDLETAFLILASLVDLLYDPKTGRDRENRPHRCPGSFTTDDEYVAGCTGAGDSFCVRCGWAVHE